MAPRLPVVALLALAIVVLVVAACGSEERSTPQAAPTTAADETTTGGRADEASVEGEGENAIVAFVRDWYERADPAICDRLTVDLLERAWELTGEAALEACRESVGDADPVEDVEVAAPAIDGDTATVVVTYTLDGEVAADELAFVLVDGVWLADDVVVTGA
jgi:hypothetical protein